MAGSDAVQRKWGIWSVVLLGWFVGALLLGRGSHISVALSQKTEPSVQSPTIKLSPDPSRGENLNILLVTFDTVSPHHLGSYGYSKARTPVSDQLARQGVLFTQAVASAPLTLPSHTSLMTSLIPPRHGLRINGSGAMAPEEITLAELLSEAGYRTAAFVASIVLHQRHGLDQGFTVYDDRVHRTGETDPFNVSERPADQVTDAALSWANRLAGEQNFFLWVHYYDPHAEYEPPPPYDRLFPLDPYDGEIAFTDAEFGRLVEGLKTRGLWENTLLVLASDHGESLGEHEEETHAIFIYDATIWVALMINPPEARRDGSTSSRWRSRVLDDQVRLIDVAPTILELVGLTPPEVFEGTSLVPMVEETGDPPPPSAYIESLDGFGEYGWARLRGVRHPPWKYIHGAREELFHLGEDPGETLDAASREPAETRRLREELESTLARARESAPRAVPVALDSESLELLRSVGYVGGADQPASGSEEAALADDEARPDPAEMIEHYNHLIAPALSALKNDEPARAKEYLERLLRVDPHNRQCLNLLAGCEIRLGNLGAARRHLEEVLRVEPDWELPHRVLAVVLRDMGELELAIAYMRQSIALLPVNPEAHEVLGSFLREKHDLEGALQEYEAAVSQDPGLTRAHFHRAQVYEQLGEFDRAAVSYHAALSSDPDHFGSLLNLGSLFSRFGPSARAVPLYQRALAHADSAAKGDILTNLGNTYATVHLHQLAVAVYREALRYQPRDAQSHYGLGCSLAFLGDIEEARREWRRAVELDPTHAAARENLERVRHD